jgi:cytosine/adenosine deaminase-related metal-dependent hydrolase
MTLRIQGGTVLADPDAQPVAADVAVEGSRIARVGRDLGTGPNAVPAAEVLDARNLLVMPGLVNAHTHAHNNLVRGAVDGLPLELWVPHLVARVAHRTVRDVYVGAALGAVEMVRTGTTCACDMANVVPWPTDETLDAVARAYADVGLRVTLAPQVADLTVLDSLDAHGVALPPDVRAAAARPEPYPGDEVLATIRRAARRWHGHADGRIRFGVGPSLPTRCSDAFLVACRELASELGLGLQTHLSETKAEAVEAWRRYGRRATEQLHALGLLHPHTVLAHSIWLDDRELDLIAAAGATVAHNPVSNLKLGAGIAPVLAMRARGIPVALGTDGSASNDTQNMFLPLRLAPILHRVTDPAYERWPDARDALRMATLAGARAAGVEAEVGRVAPGFKADLVLLDLAASHYHPRNDLVRQVVFGEVAGSVRAVVVDGRVVVRDGRVTTVDEAALLAEADEIGRRMAVEMRGPLERVRALEPYVRRAYLAANRSDTTVNRYASDAYRALPEA